MSAQDDPAEESYDGPGLVQASFIGAAVIFVVGIAGAAAPDTFGAVTAAVSIGCFVVGVIGFLWGYAVGVVRSREEAVTLGGLFFLMGSAPKIVRVRMRVAFAAQVVIAVAVAALRPYTAVAFVVLGPMLGLGLLAMWGARHGRFGPREQRR